MFSLFSKFFKTRQAGPARTLAAGGFTLAELITVIAIFSIVAAIVLANLPAFRDEVQLQLVAQEIALVARQAQYYGRATRGFGSTGDVFPSYGLYFDISNNGVGSKGASEKSFAVFGDKNANPTNPSYKPIYDDNAGELLERFAIGGTVEIGRIFSYTQPFATLGDLVVLFKRPELDASFFNKSGISLDPGNFSAGAIRLQSTRNPNSCRDIVIWTTGHIYVEKPAACS